MTVSRGGWSYYRGSLSGGIYICGGYAQYRRTAIHERVHTSQDNLDLFQKRCTFAVPEWSRPIRPASLVPKRIRLQPLNLCVALCPPG
jgi:hypothetical protein